MFFYLFSKFHENSYNIELGTTKTSQKYLWENLKSYYDFEITIYATAVCY